MISKKEIMRSDIVNILSDMAHEDNLPINITTGKANQGYVDVLVEFEDSYQEQYQELIEAITNNLIV